MKRLDRYVWRELVVPFLIGTLAVQFMFMINQLMFIFKEFSLQKVPLDAVAQALLYKAPGWLNMTLPVGTALAASLAFTRLARESELTAMRAAGTSIRRVVLPCAFFGLLVGIGNFLIAEKVMPHSERKFQEIFTKIGVMGLTPEFRSNAVIYLKSYTATFGSVIRQSDDQLKLYQILLIERPAPNELRFYMGTEGLYNNGVWTLPDTTLWRFVDGDLEQYVVGKDIVINEKIIIENLLTTSAEQTQTSDELAAAIEVGKRTGTDTRRLEVAFHTRFSVPASCIVFAAIAPVFAIIFARTGGFAGVLLSFFLVLLYYNAFIVSTEIFGKNGWLDPVIAAWLPNVVFAVIGLFAMRRLE
jgi:lipopolysaccharide export system permease protein